MSDTNTMLDAEEIRAKLERLEELEARDAERRGHYEELDRQRETRSAEAAKQYTDRIDLLTRTLETTLTRRAATDAIRGAFPGATPDDLDAILPHVLPHVGVIEQKERPGTFEVVVFAEDGSKRPRPSLRDRGNMGVGELVDTIRGHPSIGRLFGSRHESSSASTFQVGSRLVKLTAEEAKNPKIYAALKERRARGEIDGALDEQGRRLV